MVQLNSQRIELEDEYEAIQSWFLEQGWSDGLPLVPPTPARVEAMLSATDLAADHAVAELPPYGGVTELSAQGPPGPFLTGTNPPLALAFRYPPMLARPETPHKEENLGSVEFPAH